MLLSLSSFKLKQETKVVLSTVEDIRVHVNNTIDDDYYDGHFAYAVLITKTCLEKGVPVHLFMSLVKNESNFDNSAFHKNKNGSYDIGLCQLNTYTFKKYTIAQLKNPITNVSLGVKTLRDLYDYLGTWELAVLAYNAGITRVKNDMTPQSTIRYLKKVLDFETFMNHNYLGYEQRSNI